MLRRYGQSRRGVVVQGASGGDRRIHDDDGGGGGGGGMINNGGMVGVGGGRGGIDDGIPASSAPASGHRRPRSSTFVPFLRGRRAIPPAPPSNHRPSAGSRPPAVTIVPFAIPPSHPASRIEHVDDRIYDNDDGSRDGTPRDIAVPTHIPPN